MHTTGFSRFSIFSLGNIIIIIIITCVEGEILFSFSE